jgi:alpha-methylacyl-CoA racemase
MQIQIESLFESLPQRFRKEKAENYQAIFHFNIPKFPYTVSVDPKGCQVSKGLEGRADCTIKMKAKTYIAIETGKTNPQVAFLTGKIKTDNLSELARYAGLFRRFRLPEEPEAKVRDYRPKLQGPLQGIRILDLSRLLPGPLGTRLLADLGAEVIKIEDPNRPDETRNYPPFIGKQAAFALELNRSKHSLTLNLYEASGKEIFKKLAKEADIVVESFRPGVMKKMGLDFESLRQHNPRLIMVSVTGYGQQGPYAQQAGHDLNYIGYAGLLGLTGQAGGAPIIPGAQVADIAGGSYLTVIACMTALLQRQQSGKGDHIDLSMVDGVLPLLSLQFAQVLAGGEVPQRGKAELSGKLANYQVYLCQDGLPIALGALEPRFFKVFCEKVGHPEWLAKVAPTEKNHHELKKELEKLFRSRSRQEWLELAEEGDFCLSPVWDLPEVLQDPHLQARNRFTQHEHPEYGEVKGLAFPLRFTETSLHSGWASPLLGEDNETILKKLGYSEDQISHLRSQQII